MSRLAVVAMCALALLGAATWSPAATSSQEQVDPGALKNQTQIKLQICKRTARKTTCGPERSLQGGATVLAPKVGHVIAQRLKMTCPTRCADTFKWDWDGPLWLTAEELDGRPYVFTGWTGVCAGEPKRCKIPSQRRVIKVKASFKLNRSYLYGP
jgi:hypothetical protein